MLKQVSALLLTGLLVHALVGATPTVASPKEDKQVRRTAEVRAGILSLGVGPDSRVALRLRDNRTLAGYVSGAGNDSFVLTNPSTRVATTAGYGDVTQVKGHNLSTGAKIAIGIGIGIGLTFLVLYLILRNYQD